MAKSKSDISLNDLKAMLPQEGSIAEQEAALRALTTLSQEDRNLLAAVQESPYRLTTLEQFREFPANTEYFILESRVNKLDTLGWRYLFEHTDIVFPDELLKAIDPVPFGKYAMQEEQGCFTSRGYLTLSGNRWRRPGMASTTSLTMGSISSWATAPALSLSAMRRPRSTPPRRK